MNTQATTQVTQVTIHALKKRFLEEKKNAQPAPEQVGQMMYYSLAIGHHLGVVDCFEKVLECSVEDYEKWINLLPKEEDAHQNAHRKMAGLLKFGEIVIDHSHINLLGNAFVKIKGEDQPYHEWTMLMLQLLKAMTQESAMYLMIRNR